VGGSSPASVTAAPAAVEATQTLTPTRAHTWTIAADSQEIAQTAGQRLGRSRVRVTFALGSVTPATATLPAGFQELTTACEIDQAHDAVLPLRIALRNDGPVALDTTLAFTVTDLRYAIHGGDDEIPIQAATMFSDGAQCQPIGDSEGSAKINYPTLAPSESVEHNYVLVLPKFYSPKYDSNGDLAALRGMVCFITGLGVFVTGDSPNNALPLDAIACYSGPPRQAADGPGAPGGLQVPAADAIAPPPAGTPPILPAFVLAERGFNYSLGSDRSPIHQPTGYTAC
jgi:hypothetical protein